MGRNKRVDLEGVKARINLEGAGARLSRGEAAALIASKVKRQNESIATARNRIGMQLDRSHAISIDVTAGGLAIGPDNKYTVDEIKRWASDPKRYPGIFDYLPSIPGEFDDRLVDGIKFGDRIDHDVLPRTIEECHEELRRLRASLARARKDLVEARLDYEHRLKLVRNFQGKK